MSADEEDLSPCGDVVWAWRAPVVDDRRYEGEYVFDYAVRTEGSLLSGHRSGGQSWRPSAGRCQASSGKSKQPSEVEQIILGLEPVLFSGRVDAGRFRSGRAG
jgi:hypothetical protein